MYLMPDSCLLAVAPMVLHTLFLFFWLLLWLPSFESLPCFFLSIPPSLSPPLSVSVSLEPSFPMYLPCMWCPCPRVPWTAQCPVILQLTTGIKHFYWVLWELRGACSTSHKAQKNDILDTGKPACVSLTWELFCPVCPLQVSMRALQSPWSLARHLPDSNPKLLLFPHQTQELFCSHTDHP